MMATTKPWCARGRGCAELHDRMMVGLRVPHTRANIAVRGDQYTFIALASSAKAIVGYRTGKRDSENTEASLITLGRLASYWTRPLAIATPDPTETAPDRRRRFRVIEGGKLD